MLFNIILCYIIQTCYRVKTLFILCLHHQGSPSKLDPATAVLPHDVGQQIEKHHTAPEQSLRGMEAFPIKDLLVERALVSIVDFT